MNTRVTWQRNMALCVVVTSLCGIGAKCVGAEMPPGPPFTNGSGDVSRDGMKHSAVALSSGGVEVHLADVPGSPVVMTAAAGRDFAPDKFNVLEGGYFNAQHGWVPEGLFNDLPSGASIWIQRTGTTQPVDSEFHVYEGGNMMEGMASWTMAEIYLVDGANWQWDGLMQHDYFVADQPGMYTMSFEVYVGDDQGNRWSGFTAGATTLSFLAVPEPTAAAAFWLVAGALLVMRRAQTA